MSNIDPLYRIGSLVSRGPADEGGLPTPFTQAFAESYLILATL
jgi:hypothetical protein